jgi:hypothetical protein
MMLIIMPSAYDQSVHSDHPQADYKAGYEHGIADASDPCNNPRVPYLAYV